MNEYIVYLLHGNKDSIELEADRYEMTDRTCRFFDDDNVAIAEFVRDVMIGVSRKDALL